MRICLFNVENLFILLDVYNNQNLDLVTEEEWQSYTISLNQPNKPLCDLIGIKKTIEEIDADIFMLCEIGGKESLDNFNNLFLDNKYDVYVKEGNSNRGICVGYLVKKGSPYSFTVRTNKDTLLDDGHKITRDILELRAYKKGKLKLINLLVHLKSKRTSKKDLNGIKKRTSEVKAVLGLYKKLKDKYKVPIILSGDFNGHAQKSDPEDEFIEIYKTDLLDAHEVVNSSEEDRTSFVSFYTKKILRQLDYIFLSKDIHSKISNVYNAKFKNEYGDCLGIPDSFQEKKWLPSDHFPVVVDLDLK
ncbi:hypothetical protein N9948_00290 [bacterium]|nr:hypothetical protein [bacterium]